MKPHELTKIRNDVECSLHGNTVLLHYNRNRIYILSNDSELNGSTCTDMSMYRDRYRSSYFVYNTRPIDWDTRFLHDFLQDLQRIEENIGCLK